MKKIIFITLSGLFIGGIIFINFFVMNKSINIEKVKDSIVIIIPENKLISYKNNPIGIFEEYKESGIGAGFFFESNGTIQTVNHLVEDDNIKYKVIYKNIEYDAEILSRNKEKDLAIIKIIANESVIFPRLTNVGRTLGHRGGANEIYNFGVDMKDLSITYNTGIIINEKSKLDNMSNLLEISNNLKQGFSGGPIIDSKGNVIGINYAISNGKNYGIALY
ncbi:MAG: serine protease [Candidatus Gracilibacteria bacterium]|nr:serine protease [Candidatus Gracilibacteria bacterium]